MDLLLILLLSLLIIICILLLDPYLVYIISFFFYSFKCVWLWLFWPIAYTILSFFIDLIYTIVVKGKMFNCILLGAFKLLFALYAFKFFNVLGWYYTLISIVFYIIFLFPIIYISSVFELFLLL